MARIREVPTEVAVHMCSRIAGPFEVASMAVVTYEMASMPALSEQILVVAVLPLTYPMYSISAILDC